MTLQDDAWAGFWRPINERIAGLEQERLAAQVAAAAAQEALSQALDAKEQLQDEVDLRDYTITQREQEIRDLKMEIARLNVRIAELESAPTEPQPPALGARDIKTYASLDEIRNDPELAIPAGVNLVMWKPEWTNILQAYKATTSNDILVFNETIKVDASRGFMASGVAQVDGPNGTRTPVVGSENLWFEMTRIRRGLIGMSPKAKIEVINTDKWSAPKQPVPQYTYKADGTRGDRPLSGVQNSIIGAWQANSIVANFTMLPVTGLGEVSFHAIKFVNESRSVTSTPRVRRVILQGSWRGHAGVPNGETAGLMFKDCKYDVAGVTLDPQGRGSSPIMWNGVEGGLPANDGGKLVDVWMGTPSYGMPTYWYSGGVHTWTNVEVNGNDVAMNLEQTAPGFSLTITGGKLSLPLGRYHVNGNPKNGSWKINITGCQIIGGVTAGALNVHNYSPTAVQKRSDITCDRPISFHGAYLP